MKKICLISCASTKLNRTAKAKDLYISDLFRKSVAWAIQNCSEWYILSAKYGLLKPEDVIKPYDKTLLNMRKEKRVNWSKGVFKQLQQYLNDGDKIYILAGLRYRETLISLLSSFGFEYYVPMEGLSIGKQLSWLKENLVDKNFLNHLNTLYNLLDKLEEGLSGKRIFSDTDGSQIWPKKGVYFLYEPKEYRTKFSDKQRVVRVGTHGVSRGSKSSLWTRLRTHKGTKNGSGNHRSSIFRLHIGSALINKYGYNQDYPFWGKGQSANLEIRLKEKPLENHVSKYISKFSILWLAIQDETGPRSDRAYIERNCIGLLAKACGLYDFPSKHWMGKYSDNKKIRNSGLWNVDYIDYNYDPVFLDVLKMYIDVTLGKKRAPDSSLAPKNWHMRAKILDVNQLYLFKRDRLWG